MRLFVTTAVIELGGSVYPGVVLLLASYSIRVVLLMISDDFQKIFVFAVSVYFPHTYACLKVTSHWFVLCKYQASYSMRPQWRI